MTKTRIKEEKFSTEGKEEFEAWFAETNSRYTAVDKP
jgi:hypothetical protein